MITLYSEDFGTMRAMARGIYRPTSLQSMHLEALNLVEFEVIQGRAWPIISSAMLLAPHSSIKESLPKLAAAQFFTEVLDKIAFENEKDSHLWEFLTAMLVDFNQAAESETLSLFRKYQAEFLKVLGYAPQTDRCVVCSLDVLGSPDPAQSFSADRQSAKPDEGRTLNGAGKMIALSTELGGILCDDCFLAGGRGIMFDKAELGLLTGAAMPTHSTRHSALDEFFEYTVGRKISSLNFLYSVLK